ncbi:MAG: trypsin-like peptidase domain-containing protein [Pseudomonadota bacterium]
MKRFLITGCLLLVSAHSSAQAKAGALDMLSLPRPNIEAALSADAAWPSPKPYRFGVGIPVRLTPATAGLWQTLPSGLQVWRLRVGASEARSLSFAFSRFQLPQGAELSVSAPDGSDRHGPYLAEHATAGQLWTPPVVGAAALIELRLPAGAGSGLGLELTQVNYGFRSFDAAGTEEEPQAKLMSCNVDVACMQGDEWRNESRAVARLLVGGVIACSGTLMNNTARDFKPYVLTANHCFKASGFEASSTVVLWNYQKSKCRGAMPSGGGGIGGDNSGNTQTGATMRSNDLFLTPGVSVAMNSQADFALIELSQKPSAAFRVYYSGWDRRPLAPIGVVGIHHPEAQPKNISLTNRPTTISDIAGAPDAALGSFKYFLNLQGWEQGSTASGSSGSGLWNKEHRLVGNLTGGVPQESCPHTGSVIYFRFFSAWNYASKLPGRNLPQFLDPRRTGVQVLDGAYPNIRTPR